jgi:hypothetical protein
MQCINLTDHNHAPNTDEILCTKFRSKVNECTVTLNDASRKIIHELLLDIDPDDASTVSTRNYTTSQYSIVRKRKKNDIPVSTSISFENIIMVINFYYVIMTKMIVESSYFL